MDGFHKRFYRFNWGRKPDGSPRGEDELRELNGELAVSLGVLCWISLFGLFTLVVLQRFGVQWAEESWLAQCVFMLVIVSPLLSRKVRRFSFAPLTLDAGGYEQHMAQYKKGIWRGAPVFFALSLLLMPFDWQQGWLKVLVKAAIATVFFMALFYWHVRIEARRALARHEKEMAEGGE